MSPTVFDLGKKVKAKYPGQYDDLSDDEVGRKVKSKFPGDYDDFADASPSIPGMEKFGGAAPPPARVPIARPPMGVLPLPETDRLTAHPTQPNRTMVEKARTWLRGSAPPVPGTKTFDIPELSGMAEGPQEVAYGMGQAGGDITPKEKEQGMTRGRAVAGGTSRALHGAMATGSVLLPGAAASAPLRTGAGLVVGSLAKKGTHDALRSAGVDEEYADLGSDLVGIGAGGAAARYAPNAARGVATVADRLGVPEALERSAGVNYRKMLTPTSDDALVKAERVAGGPSPNGPTGLVKERPVALTRKGMMDKAQAGMKESGPRAATVYDDKPSLDPTPILEHLEGLRREKAVVKGTDVVSDPTLNGAIDELKANLEDMRGKDGKIAARSLDDFVDKLNRGLVSPKGNMRSLSPQTASAIEKSVAGRTRAYLDTAYPDAARVNAAYSTAKGTNDLLEQQRKNEIKAESGVRTGTSSGFGAALKKMIPAPLRGIPNAISSLTDSVAWDSVSGATKARIAELIRNGSLDQAAKIIKPLPKLRSVLPASKTRDVIESNTQAKPSEHAGPEWWAQQPQTGPEIQQRYEQLFNKAENLSPQRRVRVPETGVPEGVARGVDARDSISRQLLGKPFSAASPREKLAIDQLVTEGYGSVPKFAKGGIIRKPTLGLVGEAGPEAIVPVETLRRSVRGRKVLDSLPTPEPHERTSATATVPEERGTLKEQLAQLADGTRRVVMFPRGTNLMRRPDGMKNYQDADGNTYTYNPALASVRDIDAAIESNSLPDLLGATDGGMGVPDKSNLGDAVNVVPKAKNGTAVQSAAADGKSLKRAVEQAKKVTPKGGRVEVEDPAKEIQRRLK